MMNPPTQPQPAGNWYDGWQFYALALTPIAGGAAVGATVAPRGRRAHHAAIGAAAGLGVAALGMVAMVWAL